MRNLSRIQPKESALIYDFSDKLAIITGGASGMGKAFGRAIVKHGGRVILADINGAAAEAAAREIGASAHPLTLDVASERSVEESFGVVAERLGGIDILVNNAGIHAKQADQTFGVMGLTAARRMFEVNMWGVIHCSMSARPYMAERSGAVIVNISSIASYSVRKVYGVTKLAVRGLTVSLAHEFASDGIRVNGIAPGLIATETIKSELYPDVVDKIMPTQLISRVGEEKDITNAMLWLASDASSFMTGETLRVSGGASLAI